MNIANLHFPHPLVNGHVRFLLLLVFAIGLTLTLFFSGSPHAFAATQGASLTAACAQNATMEHCNNQSPEAQGCSRDAQTLDYIDIKENGYTIGRVERRWSDACHSWWGRIFDYRAGASANLFIAIAGTPRFAAPTFISPTYRILFSQMIYDASSTQPVPEITGALVVDNSQAQSTATLPVIIVPGEIK